MSKTTHCNRVLNYMRLHGSITSLEAFANLGVSRLSARIKDLRDSGHSIVGNMVEVENRYGEKCRVKRYTLREGEA